MTKGITVFFWISIAFLLLLNSANLYADDSDGVNLPALDQEFVLSISLKQEYNDNIFYDVSDEKDDFITNPSIKLKTEKKTERFRGHVAGELEYFYYADLDELNTFDGNIDGAFRHALTERWGIGASAAYVDNSQRDRDTSDTGLLINGEQKKYSGGLTTDYQLNELTKADSNLSFQKEEIGDPDDEDNQSITASVQISHNYSGVLNNTVLFLRLMYQNYESEEVVSKAGLFDQFTTTKTDYDLYQSTVGMQWLMTEHTTCSFQLGANFIDQTTSTTLRYEYAGSLLSEGEASDYASWGGVAIGSISYNGLYNKISFNLSHGMSAAQSGGVERSVMTCSYTRLFTDTMRATFTGNIYLNQGEGGTQSDLDEFTSGIKSSLFYEIDKNLELSCSYQYRQVRDREENTTTEQNLVYVGISKNFDL